MLSQAPSATFSWEDETRCICADDLLFAYEQLVIRLRYMKWAGTVVRGAPLAHLYNILDDMGDAGEDDFLLLLQTSAHLWSILHSTGYALRDALVLDSFPPICSNEICPCAGNTCQVKFSLVGRIADYLGWTKVI